MILSQAKIKGFRNFKDATINFSEKSLIIGPNDVGKTNLIYALRILLDKSLSETDIEPKDSDFYAYEETNEFSILLKISKIKEDVLRSKFREFINDEDELFLKFEAKRNPESLSIEHEFYAGFHENEVEKIENRFYLRVLNLKYISSSRNLSSFIKKEKKNLFIETKKGRTKSEVLSDEANLEEIQKNLKQINEKIPELTYIRNSTVVINEELEKLSFRNESHKVVFDVGTNDPLKIIDDVKLTSRYNEKRIEVGGDGKNNQIFFALWAAKNEIQGYNPLEISIYCIEEPEVHLHPHQQRKLAEYLAEIIKGQILITSHSPQISVEFSPNSIIRLYFENYESKAANDGCSEIINESFINFGHRLSIIPAEAFFSDVVFLVEGKSEVLLYKALAHSDGIDIDLDRENISILAVEGIEFDTFIKILNALKIKWVLRTDNDIFKIRKSDKFHFAGIKRCLKIYIQYCDDSNGFTNFIRENFKKLTFNSGKPTEENIKIANSFKERLKQYNIFLSEIDLENDLLNSEIKPYIEQFYEEFDDEIIIEKMQKRKATFMYNFLSRYFESLSELKDNPICSPLLKCKEIAEKIERL